MLPTQDTKKEWLKFLNVQSSTESTPIKPLEYDALLNTLRGTAKVAVMHQQQQQQQQMQQQQQQQQFVSENIEENAARMKRARELLEKEKPRIVGKTDVSTILELPAFFKNKSIVEKDLNSIRTKHKGDVLETQTDDGTLVDIVEEDEVEENQTMLAPGGTEGLTLDKIKRHLTPPKSDEQCFNTLKILHKITHSFVIPKGGAIRISEDALEKIIKHLAYFVNGVALDNLPAGFFIKPSGSDLDLCFDKTAFQAAFKASQKTPTDGYGQPPVLSDEITTKENQYGPVTQEVLQKISDDEPGLTPLDMNTLGELGFTENNRRALALVLNTPPNGAIKTYALLNTLIKLRKEDPTLYESIKTCFIDKSENLSEIANLETLKIIQEISKFSPAQKEWWCSLTKQHTSGTGVGKSNLADLYHTFNAFYEDLNKFWMEVYGSKLELPYPCPVGPIGNMQVALNRVAYIVKHASNPKDQLQNLQGFDLQTAQTLCAIETTPLRLSTPNTIPSSTYKEEDRPKFDFLNKLYTDNSEEDLYFPSLFTAKTFWDRLSEQMQKSIGTIKTTDSTQPYIDMIKKAVVALAANMLRHKVQAKDAFQCIDAILLFIKEKFDKLNLASIVPLLANYPIFVDAKGVPHPNPKHFELALKNPTANAGIFSDIKEPFKNKNQSGEQLPKDDILTCLLSIKLEHGDGGVQDQKQIQTVIKELYELYASKPEVIAFLARILSNTDFAQGQDNLVITKQLNDIVKACKTIEPSPPDYKAVHDLVVANCPTVKFLPDPEYATACAKETPKDLNAIIKLLEPLFRSFGIVINSENLLETATELAKHSEDTGIGGLITPQLENLQSADPNKIITGLLGIMQAARDAQKNPILKVLMKLAAKAISVDAGDIIVADRLKEIQTFQIENVVKLLKSLNFSPESIDLLKEPVNSVNLNEGELITSLEQLLQVTAWVKDFATNYVDLKKWESSSTAFLTLVNVNFANVKENINGLLSIYTTPYQPPKPQLPRLLDANIFCSPEQLLQKILKLSPTKKLEPAHILLLQKIAEKQAGSNPPIPLEQLDPLLDIVLKFPNQAALLTDLAFNKEQYGDFPLAAFLDFAKNLTNDELKQAITDLKSFFNNNEDKKAAGSFLRVLLESDGPDDQTEIAEIRANNKQRYSYLTLIIKQTVPEKQKQVSGIIEQILVQDKKSKNRLKTEQEKKAFSETAHTSISVLITNLSELPTTNDELFKKIIKLYEQKPCPNSKQLKDIVSSSNIEKCIAEFELAPHGDRDNPQKNKDGKTSGHYFKEQFATDKINQVIVGLSKNNPNLSGEFLQELKADFNYINAIGNDHPFPGTDPSKAVRKMSQQEIRNHLKECKDIIQDPDNSDAEKYLAKLHSIALLRETMYRATGKMPNSTQILSVLLQTKNKDNVCMQINTGEGKSITNPLLAAMQHLEGYAVNVFTSNTLLATRDRAEASDFWNYLGIHTSFISKGSRLEDYIEDGINYTTPADFALYSAAVGDQSIGQGPMGMAGVYDESDLAFYETNTDYNFSDSIDKENTDPYKNPYDFIYPQLNDFIAKNPKYKTLSDALKQATNDATRNEISNEIAALLRLSLKTENDQQAKALNAVDDNRLLRWLAAAESIKKLVEGKDYIVKPMERDEYGTIKKYRKICLLDGEGHEIEGAILANGAHQLLSARLQKENPVGNPFVIDQETFCISSRNAHTELLRMNKVVGITGTLGQDELIDELQKRHPATAIKVPPHNPNKRQDLRPIFANDAEGHIKLIQRELAKSIKEPQLVIGSDNKQCKDLLEKLKDFAKNKSATLILATVDGYTKHTWNGTTWTEKKLSDDPDAKEDDSVFKQAAQPNTITIATPILGRGVNISYEDKDDHKHGLKKVIKTVFDPNARLESQVDGRTGRYGAQGVTIGIYDWAQTCNAQHITGDDAILETSWNNRRKILDRIRHAAQAEEISKLHLSSEVKGISVEYQDYFDEAIRASTEIPDIKQSLLSKKCIFIEKIELLRAKTFHGKAEGDPKSIETFKKGVEAIWEEMANQSLELKLVRIYAQHQNYFDVAIRQAEPGKKQALRAAKLHFIEESKKACADAFEKIQKEINPDSITPSKLQELETQIKGKELEIQTKEKELEELHKKIDGLNRSLDEINPLTALFEPTEADAKREKIGKLEIQLKELEATTENLKTQIKRIKKTKEEEIRIIVETNIDTFKQSITQTWQESAQSYPELTTALSTQPTTRSTANYYKTKAPHFFADDIELNISLHHHQMYADKNPPPPIRLYEQTEKTILDRFNLDLANLTQKISKVRSFPPSAIKVGDIQTIVDDYIKPYFELANKLGKDDPLKQKLMSALSEKIKDIQLVSNAKHAYLHALCQTKLAADNRENLTASKTAITLYTLTEITADKGNMKRTILSDLKKHINALEPEKRTAILQSISENKPTGDTTVDYYVTCIRKKRGTVINTNAFGNTTTFRELTRYAKEELKKLTAPTQTTTPQAPSI